MPKTTVTMRPTREKTMMGVLDVPAVSWITDLHAAKNTRFRKRTR